MKTVYVSSLLIIFCFIDITIAQPNVAVTYFPLKIGNVWIYKCSAFSNPPNSSCICNQRKYRYKITGTIVRNNKTYFLFQGSQTSYDCLNCYAPYLTDTLRIDSVTGNIYRYSSVNGCSYSPFEILHDSLNSRLNDTVKNDCGASQWRYKCSDTSSQNILGTSRKTKSFYEPQFESSYGRKFAQGIGLVYAGMTFVFCSQNSSTLTGCVIDGVLYGDTSMIVGINQISTELPEKYELFQNYPNPFNPVTKIKFQIPLSRGVPEGRGVLSKLTIFDALGREEIVLVNQQLQPGTYEADWDASAIPSGVYYYKLEIRQAGSVSSSFTETKKMVLIK